MFSKNIPTICFFVITLMAVLLSSVFVRADVLSTQFLMSNTAIEAVHCTDQGLDTLLQTESGCCDVGGSCLEKQCCSSGSTQGSYLIGNLLHSYESPYRFVVNSTPLTLYSSADMRSLYRPPIA